MVWPWPSFTQLWIAEEAISYHVLFEMLAFISFYLTMFYLLIYQLMINVIQFLEGSVRYSSSYNHYYYYYFKVCLICTYSTFKRSEVFSLNTRPQCLWFATPHLNVTSVWFGCKWEMVLAGWGVQREDASELLILSLHLILRLKIAHPEINKQQKRNTHPKLRDWSHPTSPYSPAVVPGS